MVPQDAPKVTKDHRIRWGGKLRVAGGWWPLLLGLFCLPAASASAAVSTTDLSNVSWFALNTSPSGYGGTAMSLSPAPQSCMRGGSAALWCNESLGMQELGRDCGEDLVLGFSSFNPHFPMFWLVLGLVGCFSLVLSLFLGGVFEHRKVKNKKKRNKVGRCKSCTHVFRKFSPCNRDKIFPWVLDGLRLCKYIPLARRVGIMRRPWPRQHKGGVFGAVPVTLPGIAQNVPFRNFHGGAGGSAATARKRNDKQLLEGLRQLLQTCDNPSDNSRGRQNRDGRSGDRSRSPSPAQDTSWVQVAKGGKPRKRGKGKGAGEFVSNNNFQSTPSSPRRVTFDTEHTKDDGNKTLLAQLRALIMEAEVDQGFNLRQGLLKLVNQQSGPKNQPESKDRSVTWPKPKTAPTPARQHLHVHQQWWSGAQVSPKKALDKLEQGEVPEGNLIVATWQDCENMKAIAASHKIEAKVALIASDALPDSSETTKDFTEKWVKTQQGHWTKVWCTPLTQSLPDWGECPTIQKVEDVGGVFKSIDLKTFRVVFPRCYLTCEDWNLACKTPVKLLSSILPVGVTFRAYGWHHNPATKEEAVIGFCKLPDSAGENPMTKSGWKAGFFQPVNLPGQPEPSNVVDSQHKQKSCRVFT